MAINLGNVAGVVRGVNPPLEEDGITEKRYVLWAKELSSASLQYEIHYFDVNTNQWQSLQLLRETLLNLVFSIGNLPDLQTSEKSNLVLSINEVLQTITDFIDDDNESTSKTYSSTKVQSLIDTLYQDITGNVDADFNTLEKIQNKIEEISLSNDGAVKYNETQSLSVAEQNTAASNINVFTKNEVGDVSEDLLNYYNNL